MKNKQLSLKEIKEVQLGILLCVSDFCDRHNLRYYLAYGTLIGAVRHKGYIPWDDDIDIIMPREDYNSFISSFNTEMAGSNYLAIPPYNDGYHTFLKVADTRTLKTSTEYAQKGKDGGHLIIDIFPLDGVPETDYEYTQWFNRLHKIYQGYYLKHKIYCGTLKNRIKTFVRKLQYHSYKSKKSLKKEAEHLHNLYPYENCNYVGVVESCWNSPKNKVKKEWYNDYVLLDFEGYQFKAPKGYHEVLSSIYGDYMELPPVDQRIPCHQGDIFWR